MSQTHQSMQYCTFILDVGNEESFASFEMVDLHYLKLRYLVQPFWNMEWDMLMSRMDTR